MLNEFKEFALKGNVMDLAIGVIIGAAFNKIVSSLVEDVFMPIIGFVTGGLDFSNYFWQLKGAPAASYAAAKAAGATVGYGAFITVAINFVIVAFILFLFVRMVNRLRASEPKVPPKPTMDQALLTEIRDLIAKKAA